MARSPQRNKVALCTRALYDAGMETIPVRKFRANLKDFIARIGKGEAFLVNGVMIGLVNSKLAVPVPPTPDQAAKAKELDQGTVGDLIEKIQTPDLVSIPEKTETICELCKEPKECREKTEDGEDHLVCAYCVRARYGMNWMLVWKKMKPRT